MLWKRPRFLRSQTVGLALGCGCCRLCALDWVSVADVFAQFGGPSDGMTYLTGTGGEPLPAGIDPQTVAVERSIPLTKGLKSCLLVWEMNGEPLPLVHGGPVRLLVPGYFGVNNVKWLRTLAATTHESSNKIQQSGYRMRPVGESGNASHPSMYRMPVKSWINSPRRRSAHRSWTTSDLWCGFFRRARR